MKRAIEAVLSASWAIMPEWLETIASIAERENEYHGNLQALEAKLGRPLGNTMTATVRDGVAIIPIEGPMFRRANLMTAFSGASSYDVIAQDIAQALADPAVDAILLNISSPGGEVEGASELAQMIADAGKPVWAHAGGAVASAAYWVASAADRIVAADTAMVGSIGVQAGYTVREPRAGEKSFRFVSSQSPQKNASPDTEAGAAQIQSNIDALAQVFVATIARNRSISESTVLESYGAGAVFVAADALERGMIDQIGTFESTLRSLRQEIESMNYTDVTVASLTEARPDLVAEIKKTASAEVATETARLIAAVETAQADGAAAERARITAIEAMGGLPGTAELIARFKADGTKPEAAALEIVKAAQAAGAGADPAANAGAAHLDGLKAAEAGISAPTPSAGVDTQLTDEEAAAQAVKMARSSGLKV